MVVYAKITTKRICVKSNKADFWAVFRVDKKEKRAYYLIKEQMFLCGVLLQNKHIQQILFGRFFCGFIEILHLGNCLLYLDNLREITDFFCYNIIYKL